MKSISGIEVHCAFDKEVDLVDLVPHPRNPNKHDDRQIGLLAKIIRNQGWRNPIVVSDRSGFIVSGHGRKEAAHLLGVEKVPVDRQSFTNEAEEYAHLIADNRIAELAEPSKDELAELIKELEGKIDLDLTGFDAPSLADLLDDKKGNDVDAEAKIDEAAELQKKWNTAEGQLWKLGDHRLVCGDSENPDHVELLMDGKKAALVLTDPPYGISYQSCKRIQNPTAPQFNKLKNDDVVLTEWIKVAAENTDSWIIFFCAWQRITEWIDAGSELGDLTNILIWKKAQAMGDLKGQFSPSFEIALAYNRGGKLKEGVRKSAVFDMPIESARNFMHPTQKPVKLFVEILEGLPDGSVFDPFMGSGTSLIACEQTGRKSLGMEIDPKFAAVILERFKDATGEEPELINGN